jgi:hypothetical protein
MLSEVDFLSQQLSCHTRTHLRLLLEIDGNLIIDCNSSDNRRQFVSSSSNAMANPSMMTTTNGGIISEKTKWQKKIRDQ